MRSLSQEEVDLAGFIARGKSVENGPDLLDLYTLNEARQIE